MMEVDEFLKREFGSSTKFTISAFRRKPGAMRFVVRDPVTDGDRQRIRNFFQTIC